MGDLFSSMIDHGIAFDFYSDLPWIMTDSSQAAYFLRLAGL